MSSTLTMRSVQKNISVQMLNETSGDPSLTAKLAAISITDKEDAYFVADLGDVVRKHKLFSTLLPRVEPHYAVKCNGDLGVLSVLAQLGLGFDCASKAEISKVLGLKVSPDRIIYANPCKQSSHIKYAAKKGVAMMTFDNESELHKVKALYPNAKLVLRMLPPLDTKCQCQLGMKFGVHPKHAAQLLRLAKQLKLDVIGVSFHVGSGCYEATAFSAAVASARTVFDMAAQIGFNLSLLDIGGGFPGQKNSKISFEQICSVLAPALDTYFPHGSGVRIIAEPGRFYVASAFTLAVNIIAKRAVPRDRMNEELTANDEPTFMYYVNDGVYGSFNCLLYDHAVVPLPVPILTNGNINSDDDIVFTSSVWGPTCDGIDCILARTSLPECEIGDWLVFSDMGAYTSTAASTFNGMPKPAVHYVSQPALWHQMCKNACNVFSPLVAGIKTISLEHDNSPYQQMPEM